MASLVRSLFKAHRATYNSEEEIIRNYNRSDMQISKIE